MKQKHIQLLLSLVAPVLFAVGPFSKVLSTTGLEGDLYLRALVIFVVLFSVYFLNYFVFLPSLFFRKRYVLYAGVVLISLVVVQGVNYLLFHHWLTEAIYGVKVDQDKINSAVHLGPFSTYNNFPVVVACASMIIIGIAIRMTHSWGVQQRKNITIQKERLEAELAFLKNQINPHFFFNTLNNIYSLIETNPEKAQEITHLLSKLMRYLLYETEQGSLVTLGREITFLKSYMELMRVRQSDDVSIEFEHDSETETCLIPPLLFISFVENAFKHGISSFEPSRVRCELYRRGERIYFSIINTKPIKGMDKGTVGGVGLKNIRRRLELLYPKNRFELEVFEGDKMYEVKLIVPIEND